MFKAKYLIPGALLALVFVCSASADKKWHVAQAPVRFTIRLSGNPTHKSAGYFVQIPDGGILPRPYAQPIVVTADGSALKSYLLWQNGATGCGIIFDSPPKAANLFIYFVPTKRLKLWSAATGLTPSTILCTNSGRGSKADALALARLGSVSSSVHYRNRAGVKQAPLSVPGDLSGRSGPCSIYMLAHVDTTDPGKTLIAPIKFAGEMEVHVDGKTIKTKEVIDKPGGSGQYVELAKGLHRIEILCWSTQGSAPKNGLMTLMWQTPKTTMAQMGGKRASDLNFPGTSMWASRKLHNQEIVRSGGASVIAAEARDGGPVASFSLAPAENYWFADEAPVMIYNLSARRGGNPENTRYIWNFGNGSHVEKPDTEWLFSGGANHLVSLTAVAGDKQSICKVPFYPYTTRRTSMNNSSSRQHYLSAALDVFTAYPGNVDPTANWNASYWNNFFRSLELNKNRELLTHIVNVRWKMLSTKLPADRLELLKELALDFAPRVSPNMALKWIRDFGNKTKDKSEKTLLEIKKAEILMCYLDDTDGAKAVLSKILRSHQRNKPEELARIRMGDLALMAGDMNVATKLYGDVQNRSKHQSLKTTRAIKTTKKPLKLSSGLARSKAEFSANREKNKLMWAQKKSKYFPGANKRAVADWKLNALLDVSASETVNSLLDQGFLLEAKRALQRWELEFPLSKLSSDYLINEARFYMAVGDWKRARSVLEPYCEYVDASSFMAPAVEALLECKEKLNESDADIVKFCKKMKKKLEFHPISQKLDREIRMRK